MQLINTDPSQTDYRSSNIPEELEHFVVLIFSIVPIRWIFTVGLELLNSIKSRDLHYPVRKLSD